MSFYMTKLKDDLYIGETGYQLKNIKEVYSTNEVKTNKVWIDNKPIYRKIYSLGNIYANSEVSLDTNISNFGDMINIHGKCIWNTNFKFPIPYINKEGDQRIQAFYRSDTNKVYIGTNIIITNCILILEYTKTTD